MSPLEVGVAEVRGTGGGEVGVENVFSKHFAYNFPAHLLPPCRFVQGIFIPAVVLSA